MKRKITGILFIGLTVIALGACKKDSKNPGTGGSVVTPPIVLANKFEGKVNGVMKAATTFNYTHSSSDDAFNFDVDGPGGISWGIIADTNIIAGQVYQFGGSGILIGYSNDGGNTGYISESGTVTVIKNDHTANIVELKFQGAFEHIETSEVVTVTNGHMVANYTE